jgi:multidrug resistance efflux pump
MSKLFFTFLLLAHAVVVAETNAVRKLVCVGHVELVGGEVEVCAQMSGTLSAVFVQEGDWVTNGTVLASVDARREKAALDLALAKLARVKAGNGQEEIAAAEALRDAIAAELAFAESEYQRGEKLREQKVLAEDERERRQQRVATLRKQLVSAEKQAAALKRGPLPEDIALAEAEATAARVAYDLRLVRAESDGAVLELRRHTADAVSVMYPTPILRMADTRRLRARIEVNEQDVYRVKPGMKGEFTTFGATQPGGQLVIKTVLPAFAPRRLFEPDSTARMDTRTLQVLCEITGEPPVYPGQRLTATFTTSNP